MGEHDSKVFKNPQQTIENLMTPQAFNDAYRIESKDYLVTTHHAKYCCLDPHSRTALQHAIYELTLGTECTAHITKEISALSESSQIAISRHNSV